jgi:hypothetical protein
MRIDRSRPVSASPLGGRPFSRGPTEQVGCLDIHGLGQFVDNVDASRVNASLQRTDVGAIDISQVGKRLLRKPFGLPLPPQIGRKNLPDLHPQQSTALSSIYPRSILYKLTETPILSGGMIWRAVSLTTSLSRHNRADLPSQSVCSIRKPVMTMLKSDARKTMGAPILIPLSLCLLMTGASKMGLAQPLDVPADMHCGVYQGEVFDPPFTAAYNFQYSSGSLIASRRTQRHPGTEKLSGTIAPDGDIRIGGGGAYDNTKYSSWTFNFHGKIPERGAAAVAGELFITYTGFKRQCSLVFREPGEQLSARLALRTSPTSKPVVSASPTLSKTAAAAPAAQIPQTIINNNLNADFIVNNENAASVNGRIADLQSQIQVLEKVAAEQLELQKTASNDLRASVDRAVEAVNAQLARLKSEYSSIDKSFTLYLTSVTPNDRDLYLTARKASEVYPKIPYYIPGTSETGEFWVEPGVSDRGEMRFGFKFVDATAAIDKVRETIDMTLPEIEDTQKALFTLRSWSDIAHQQKLRKVYEKRVTCFPVSECAPDGERTEGKASTEIRFNVYEDGSTAGRIQRNKGRFIEGYNVSIESAMLLQAYLAHVIKEAKQEFDSGTQDKKSLDQLFQ